MNTETDSEGFSVAVDERTGEVLLPAPPAAAPKMLEGSHDHRAPRDLHAERSILGSILIDNELAAEVADLIHPLDFFDHGYRLIYGAMLRMSENHQDIDVLTLGDEIRKRGDLEAVGGPDGIAWLHSQVPVVTNVSRYAKIVREHAERRAAITAMQRALGKLFEAEDEPANVISDVQARLDDAVSRHDQTDLVDIRSSWLPLMGEMSKAHEAGQRVIGTASGFTDLDYMTAGFGDGDYVVIGGSSGMGKTMFATAMALNIATSLGLPVPFFSLEMKQRAQQLRILAQAANVDGMRIRTAQLQGNDWTKLAPAVNKLARTRILMDDGGEQTVQAIRGKYRRARNRYGKLGGVFVDYVQLVMPPKISREGSREQEVSAISRGFKALSKEMDCPLFILAQLNDGPDKREGHRPRPEDVRESRTVRHDCDTMLLVHQPSKFSDVAEDVGIFEVIVAKQRNGPEGIVRLRLEKESMALRNLMREGR